MKRLHLNREWTKTTITVLTAIVVGLFFIIFLQQQKLLLAYSKNAKTEVNDHSETLTQIQDAVGQVKADNAQQTLILCTLILENSANLNDAQRSQVSNICHQQVASPQAVTSKPKVKSSQTPTATAPQPTTTSKTQETTTSGPEPKNNNGPIRGLLKKLGL